jgi:hypothetical protein
MKVKLITVGTDPEFFIKNLKTHKFVSSENLVGGTKDNPIPIFKNGEYTGHGIQEDNVMAEITIPPVTEPEQLYEEVNFVIDYLNDKLQKHNPDYNIEITSSATFTDKELDTEQAKTVGCSADYNAWLREENPKIEVTKTNTRWAGGHIHIGYENISIDNTVELIKAFDMFIGIPFVIKDPNDDRKKVYGSAGRFRFTPYGFEYRTLSNYWLSDLELIKFVFNQIKLAFDFVNNNKIVPDEVKEIIDTVNKEKAKVFLENNIYTISNDIKKRIIKH